MCNMGVLILSLLVLVSSAYAQEATDCFGPGSVAGAAIGGFLGALVLVALGVYLRRLFLKKRKGKHLVLSTDPENVKDEFAFDNPGFKTDEKVAWSHDAPTLPVGGREKTGRAPLTDYTRPEQTRDDLHINHARTRLVKLWARDFTGLGLRCGGGARAGVLVHSVLKSGPAAHAQIAPGNRIKSIKIEFTGTPLEDAVSILSLASPYPVELEVTSGGAGGTIGGGRGARHPLLRAASFGDVSTLEKETKHLVPPRSPDTSHSNNSTLEHRHPKGIKKITDKIITSTLERNKKEKKELQTTTLERENEKNSKMAAKNRHSEASLSQKVEKTKARHSIAHEGHGASENGNVYMENAEVQRRESDLKKPMKFGIRVLPPNVPDDGVLKQKNVENGVVAVEANKRPVDETDKSHLQTQIRHENEVDVKKPVVAKRREKMAPPIPNARTKVNETEMNTSVDSKKSDNSFSSFARNDLNSSGIKRDENGIPQELPAHMLQAAKAARSNRKSSIEIIDKIEPKKDDLKPKKAKGKAPSPPAGQQNKTDDSILEQLNNVSDFLNNEKEHSSILHDHSIASMDTTATSINTSTPKVNKMKASMWNTRIDDTMTFTQDDIEDIVSKPFKKESDSLNNFYADSKSNLSSNIDAHSIVSFNNSEKSEKDVTVGFNNSDITLHSSPNETLHSVSDEASVLDENERKAASLGDLSRFEMRAKVKKPSTGTLERAQSLDISGEDAEESDNNRSPKKRKAFSVVESTYLTSKTEEVLPEIEDTEHIVINHKEPRLSLNIAKTSAMEGLNTFQRNRLKKASEFGTLQDAIVQGSNSSIDSDRNESQDNDVNTNIAEEKETSDNLARKIMDENLKVHLKLVSEFAKSTSDVSGQSSPKHSHEEEKLTKANKYDEKITTNDTNIPDDMKVSRSTYVNSLERPKSEMMRKLLAKNPILNVHVDQNRSEDNETPTPMTDASKSAIHQPDIVEFNLKTNTESTKPSDVDDFVSNIRVGSNTPKHRADSRDGDNVVTISTKTEKVPLNSTNRSNTYTKSIEIGETAGRHIPDVIEGINRRNDEKEGRTLLVEPQNVSITMTEEPAQKTVTVNVAEDEFGNKVITQNVEKVSTKYATSQPAPLQIEQISFGMTRNPQEISELDLEEGNIRDFDKNLLDEIKKQNPNMHFTTDEPSYTKTETIILNTQLDEEEAMALMEKIKNDPNFMSQKTPEELAKLGIKIIRDLEDVKHEDHDTIEVSKTRYSINPATMERATDHVTEIQVITPKTEKQMKQRDKIANRQRAPIEELPLSYELDIDLLNDFISNERHHSAKQMIETKAKRDDKRHSDFDLPRNSSIKFRTATYESPKGTIVTSTDIENRRLSQLDQMQLRADSKPTLAAKPSNIPVKTPEKPRVSVNSSKIPVFMSQRSLSQENLRENSFSLPRSPPPALSGSSGNIAGNVTVTSIKSSSKHPSGK